MTDIPRTCPKCNQPIFGKSGRVSQCSVCQASQVHTDLGHQETPLQSTGGPRRTALVILFSWLQRYRAALERFCVTLWPTSLFTFTTEERRALRLAGRGNYKFTEIKDPRIAKWLSHRAGSSALSGLTTIQPAIAKQLVKTSDSLRLSGIQYLDESLALHLVRHSGRTLYLDKLYHVDLEVLEILVTHAGRGLSLGGIKNLSIQEASVLARYRGRLSLNNLLNLNSETLAALVQHTGKSISLAALEKISHPQAQQLKEYRGDLYLRGLREIPLAIESEFIEFPGKIVLKHHERRPIQTYASDDTSAKNRGARIELWIITFSCIAALFALLVAALSNF